MHTLIPVLPVVLITAFVEKENILILNTSMGARLFRFCPSWTLVMRRSQLLQGTPRLGRVRGLGARPGHHFAGEDVESPRSRGRSSPPLEHSVVRTSAGFSDGQSLCFPLK